MSAPAGCVNSLAYVRGFEFPSSALQVPTP